MTRKELNIILLLTFSMGLLPFQTMADSVNDQNVTLSWPLGNGNEDNTSAIVSREGLFSVASFNHGTLKVTTQRSAGTSRQTLYNPSENTGAPTDGDNLSFTMKAKRGVVFQPKSFSFESSRNQSRQWQHGKLYIVQLRPLADSRGRGCTGAEDKGVWIGNQ